MFFSVGEIGIAKYVLRVASVTDVYSLCIIYFNFFSFDFVQSVYIVRLVVVK